MIVQIWRNLWCWTACKKSTAYFTISLRYCKVLQTYCFGHFENVWRHTPKGILSSCRKLSCLSTDKKIEILQRYAHFFLWFFGYFGHTWLHTSKMIVSTCRRLWCLSASLKHISSFTSFLRHYILKHPNWLTAFWFITQEPGFCQIWDCWWNINNITIFHFRLSPGKTNDKNFQRKIKTNLFWGQFWVFLSKFQEK